MGMYDTVTFRDPRWPDLCGRTFQTKDLDCTMDEYTITEAGRLVHHQWGWEETPEAELPDKDRPYLGMIRRKAGSERIIDMNHHGDIYLGCQWIARFTDGVLESVREFPEARCG